MGRGGGISHSCEITVGYMSREGDWARDTDLGLISIETVFRVQVWIRSPGD